AASATRALIVTAEGGRVDLRTGALLDPLPLGAGEGYGGAAIAEGVAYHITRDSPYVLRALDLKTRTSLWSARYDAFDILGAGPVVGGGVVWVFDRAGELQAFDASNGGRLLALRVNPPGSIYDTPDLEGPVVTHGYVVITSFGLQVFSVPR